MCNAVSNVDLELMTLIVMNLLNSLLKKYQKEEKG